MQLGQSVLKGAPFPNAGDPRNMAGGQAWEQAKPFQAKAPQENGFHTFVSVNS